MAQDILNYYREKTSGNMETKQVIIFDTEYTVATLPDPATCEGAMAVVTDGGPGGAPALGWVVSGVWNYMTAASVSNGAITGAKLSAAAGVRSIYLNLGTIATTGSSKITIPMPTTGTLSAVKLTAKDALAADNTNYLTFTITNKGQSGAGSTAMLSATASGTTQLTGGAAIAAYTARALPLHATGGNAAIVANDCLEFSATATGTLANTVTETMVRLDFTFTT
jgi:hypothetical protein